MLGAAATAAAQAQQPVLSQGNAVVTGFSGTAPEANPPSGGDPADALFIDVNGASARILSLPLGGEPPQGQVIPSPTVLPVKAGDVGQVFGIALDDGKGPDGTLSGLPDIYLTATSAFGLQIVTPGPSGQLQRLKAGQAGAQWMAGQWGDSSKGATPGSIWKVNGTTGEVTLFANVVLNGQPNSGPGLGNVAFDPQSRQMFVSDLETGMIHRFSMQGQDLGYFDHGTQGRVAQGLAPVPYDPANRLDITNPAFNVNDATTWHFVQKGRMVWGLKVNSGRLYYATADGPQVWSIAIGADGSFGNDPRMEIDVTGTVNNNAISDVTFDGPNMIYLAQRGTAHGDYTYETFADPAKSQVIRYLRDPQTGKWAQTFEEYAVGFPPEYRNTNGGVAIDTCNNLVWTTGELLRQGSGLSGPENVHGLQGMDKSLLRPANVPPKQSYFAEYNPQFEDPSAHGHMGDVEVWHPCQVTQPLIPPGFVPPPTGTFNLTLTKEPAPYFCPPGVYCKQPPAGSNPTDCIPGGQGWLCSYKIVVRNTGSTPYAGPLTVADWLPSDPPGAIISTTPLSPWTCSPGGPDEVMCVDPFVSLNPGDSIELDIIVDLPQSYPDCYLDNAAEIVWPAGYGDANPADDFAYASDHIPGTHCPPPQGNKTNLRLQKFARPYCKPIAGGFLCEYLVWVTNTGPGVYSDKITVADTLPAGDTLAAVSPPWNCVGGPPTYQCTHPPVMLNPGQSRGFLVWVKVPLGNIKPNDCDVTNHAHITWAPGGSDENTNPGDDDASATAKIQSDRCYGKQTNLKIEKFGRNCSTLLKLNSMGYQCYFLVRVTNTGPGNFNQPIVISDVFSPAPATNASFATNPPWNCTGSAATYQCTDATANLAPGQSVDLIVYAELSIAGVRQGQCTLNNTAHIVSPPGGSPQNTNPGDDTASATDTLNVPQCQPLIQSVTKGHVSILKTCKASAVGAGIECSITVTNDGGQPIPIDISFGDKGQWTGNGSPMHVLAAKPDSPAISCGGLPDHLNCTLPGSALPPGASHGVEIELAPGDGQVNYKNCAMLVSVDGSPLTGPGHESCVTGGGDISVLKTGPATCIAGEDCTFQVAIINNSGAPYSGPLLLGDTLFLNSAEQQGMPITGGPAFGCPQEPSSLPFNCVARISLNGHEQRMHTVNVRMPRDLQQGDGLNCFFATDGAAGLPGAAGTTSLAGFNPRPGNGPGYSCVPFKLLHIEHQCPGEQVFLGTQCQCPDGTVPGPRFTCHRRGGVVPVIPACTYPLVGIYPDCHCPEGTFLSRDAGTCVQPKPGECHYPLVGDYPDCHCPAGLTAVPSIDGTACVSITRRCESPLVGTFPDCHCPEGTFYNGDRHTCVRPSFCRPPMIGTFPDCHCPEGTVDNADRNTCGQPHKQCQYPLVGDYPNCHCPNGTTFNADRNTCGQPQPTCAPPRSLQNGQCACPRDLPFWNGSTCTRPPVTCTGGKVSNNEGGCVCPNGERDVGGRCVVPSTKSCPEGSSGSFPNCVCHSQRETWNGSACVFKGTGDNGNNGNNTCKGVVINGVCVTKLIPKITTCPANEHWNGSACVRDTTGTTGLPHFCPGNEHWNGRACVSNQGGPILKPLNIPGLHIPGLQLH